MFKLLLKILALLVVVLVGYNFFLGTKAERDSSHRVVGQVRELGASVFDLLKSEKEKLSEGKYDEAFANLKQVIGMETEQAAAMGEAGQECLDHCEHLEEKERQLERQFQSVTTDPTLTADDKVAALEVLRGQLLQLTSEAETLAHEIGI